MLFVNMNVAQPVFRTVFIFLTYRGVIEMLVAFLYGSFKSMMHNISAWEGN